MTQRAGPSPTGRRGSTMSSSNEQTSPGSDESANQTVNMTPSTSPISDGFLEVAISKLNVGKPLNQPLTAHFDNRTMTFGPAGQLAPANCCPGPRDERSNSNDSSDSSGSGDSRVSGRLIAGPSFTTDMSIQTVGSRYVRFGNIPYCWLDGEIYDVLTSPKLKPLIMSKQVKPDRSGGFLTLAVYAHFDDLRGAIASCDIFGAALPTFTFKFIDADEYFAQDIENEEAASISMYDGQIEFVVSFIGQPKDFHLSGVFEALCEYATGYGDVRSVRYQERSKWNAWRFRIEYFSIHAARLACAPDEIKTDVDIGAHLVLRIQEYRPRGYCRYAHPAVPPAALKRKLKYRESRPWCPGPERDNAPPQHVIINSILAGFDCRTTIMIRNIPNQMNADEFKGYLDATSHGRYTFSYLRIDFSNNANVGYAFVDFVNPMDIVDFVRARWGRPYGQRRDKKCDVSYATIQGYDCLVAKFRNSSVMKERPNFRPRVFYTEHSLTIPERKRIGGQAEFPLPDNQSKLQRSVDNAQSVGLYPPRSGQHSRNMNRRRSNYDRGTPHALREEMRHALQHDRHNDYGTCRAAAQHGPRVGSHWADPVDQFRHAQHTYSAPGFDVPRTLPPLRLCSLPQNLPRTANAGMTRGGVPGALVDRMANMNLGGMGGHDGVIRAPIQPSFHGPMNGTVHPWFSGHGVPSRGNPALQQRDHNSQQRGHNSQQRGHNPQQRGHNPQQRGHNPQQRGHNPQQRNHNSQQRDAGFERRNADPGEHGRAFQE